MRFGSELLRKAEQIFTIIHEAPPQRDCFPPFGRCLRGSEVMETAPADEPSGCGVTHNQKEKGKWGGEVAINFGPSKDKYS